MYEEVNSLVLWTESWWLSSSNFYSSCNVGRSLSILESHFNKIRKLVSLKRKLDLLLAYRVILSHEPSKITEKWSYRDFLKDLDLR